MCIKAGEKLNQREIAKMLKVSPTAISKALPLIEKEGLIKIEKNKRMNLILASLDGTNQKALHLKRAENLKMLCESGLDSYLEEFFPGATIILFGSYSRGDDTIKSDIDVAIIGRKEKEINLNEYEKTLQRKIILNFYPSFKEIHKHLKENICNGLVLSGGIEL